MWKSSSSQRRRGGGKVELIPRRGSIFCPSLPSTADFGILSHRTDSHFLAFFFPETFYPYHRRSSRFHHLPLLPLLALRRSSAVLFRGRRHCFLQATSCSFRSLRVRWIHGGRHWRPISSRFDLDSRFRRRRPSSFETTQQEQEEEEGQPSIERVSSYSVLLRF